MSNYLEKKLLTGPILAGFFCPALKAKFSKSIWPPWAGKIRASKVFIMQLHQVVPIQYYIKSNARKYECFILITMTLIPSNK